MNKIIVNDNNINYNITEEIHYNQYHKLLLQAYLKQWRPIITMFIIARLF